MTEFKATALQGICKKNSLESITKIEDVISNISNTIVETKKMKSELEGRKII